MLGFGILRMLIQCRNDFIFTSAAMCVVLGDGSLQDEWRPGKDPRSPISHQERGGALPASSAFAGRHAVYAPYLGILVLAIGIGIPITGSSSTEEEMSWPAAWTRTHSTGMMLPFTVGGAWR
jgi:hypothetical protein